MTTYIYLHLPSEPFYLTGHFLQLYHVKIYKDLDIMSIVLTCKYLFFYDNLMLTSYVIAGFSHQCKPEDQEHTLVV